MITDIMPKKRKRLKSGLRMCVTKCVTTDGGRLTPASFLCFFRVAKFESRLALSFFARKSSNHAGFWVFLYFPKVLDLCWTEHLQSRLPIRELPLRCRKCPADAAVLLRDGKQ